MGKWPPGKMRAKKSYGQHFLNNENIAQKIIEEVVSFNPDLPLVEVGPGKGVLTKYLFLAVSTVGTEIKWNSRPFS